MKHNPDKLFTGKVLLFNGVLYSRKEFGPFCTMLLIANTTKWLNTLEQFVGSSREIVWVCLTILRLWGLKRFLFFLFQFLQVLTHIKRRVSFYAPWKYQKTRVYLKFSGVWKETSSMKWVNFKYCLTSK